MYRWSAPGWAGFARITRSRVARISGVSGCMLPSGFHRSHGRRFMRASARSVARVEVVGEAPRHLAHGVGVGAVERRALGARRRGMTLRERLDGRPLARRHPVRPAQGFLDRRVGHLLPLGVGRAVVVRPLREGDAPVAHRARRIEARRLAERVLGLDVVEGVDEPQALVEVRLRLGRAGRDALVVAPETFEDHRRRRRAWPGVAVGARLARAARERDREDAEDCVGASTHTAAPSVVNASISFGARVHEPTGTGAPPFTDRAPCAETASRDPGRDRPSTSEECRP